MDVKRAADLYAHCRLARHVEVTATSTVRKHGQASASGNDDQNERLPGHKLDDQQGNAAPDAAATCDHLPDSGWTVLLTRLVAQQSQMSPAHRLRAEEAGEHPPSAAAPRGEPTSLS